jgi:formylglycine-generating enzyme required for sulfatase activity
MTVLHPALALPSMSLVLPLALFSALSGLVAVKTGMLSFDAPAMPLPQTVVVAAGSFDYRMDGEYFKAGFAVDGPMVKSVMRRPVEIMKYQVSVADYDQCTAEGACAPRESDTPARSDMPVTGVNFDDAQAYAAWFSKKSGETWRLPSDMEIAFAAGSDYPDDALGSDPDSKNPALRWLADYEREASRKAARDPKAQPYGAFGENEHGLADFAGNVWEWTTTCHRRVNLDKAGKTRGEVESCGIYVVSGKHRAPLSSFIRDPKGGGCSVGTPPDNVGFRLLRDTRWYAPLVFAISRAAM